MSKFNEQDFEHKLFKLKDSHDSIASLSNWCLARVDNHNKIVATWLGTLKKVKIEHRILLFYLANDIIQYSKKKGLAFVGTFAPALQKATTMVRDAAIKNKILRIFKIWDERNIYDESFLVDLSSLLTRGHKTANRIDLDEFQPNLLYSRLKSCQTLEEDTDTKMKLLVENQMPMTDTERLRSTLKNRKASEDVIAEIDEGIKKIGAFISALEAEIKERAGLIDLLDISEQYYEKELGEAKVVSNAYKCFTNRVKLVKKKLDEKMESLPSPVPTPSPTAPSPEPEDDADGKTFEFTPGMGGASFMDGSLFTNASVQDQFQSFYNPPTAPERYSPTSSSYNGSALTAIPGILEPTAEPLTAAAAPLVPPPPPINVPPVFNYFRPIADVPPPPPPPPPPAPPVDALDNSYNNSTFLDSTADLSTGGLKIEVINSPSKEPSLSSILETMVSDTIPPPPAPPAMDFPPNWNDNPEYWESPESPPLFEKEGQAPPNVDDITDVDMRSKDVDHRNLISLTGGVETEWEYPPADVDIPQDNEDMEMSEEDEDMNISSEKANVKVPPLLDNDFRIVPQVLADQVKSAPYQLPPPPPPPPMVPQIGPPIGPPLSPDRQNWSQFPPPPTPPFEPPFPLDSSTPLRNERHIPIKPPPLPPRFPQQAGVKDFKDGPTEGPPMGPDLGPMMGPRMLGEGPDAPNDGPMMGPGMPNDGPMMGTGMSNDGPIKGPGAPNDGPMMGPRMPNDRAMMGPRMLNDGPMIGPGVPNDRHMSPRVPNDRQLMGPRGPNDRQMMGPRGPNDRQMNSQMPNDLMGRGMPNDHGQPIPSFDNYNQEGPHPRFSPRFRPRFDFRGNHGGFFREPRGFSRGGPPRFFQRPRFPHQGF
ncbi:DUF618 [Nesidiocoris tenuis]|uniref:DUF618 n=1 Tax=Nesidiocoris tenuis TaxID=355587 RepID=A0ABN7BF22_9HEMI|nr:DUF618 [Nesidiocoris tenuis]